MPWNRSNHLQVALIESFYCSRHDSNCCSLWNHNIYHQTTLPKSCHHNKLQLLDYSFVFHSTPSRSFCREPCDCSRLVKLDGNGYSHSNDNRRWTISCFHNICSSLDRKLQMHSIDSWKVHYCEVFHCSKQICKDHG